MGVRRLLGWVAWTLVLGPVGVGAAQPPGWFVTPDRQDVVGLVRHAGAWHVALEESSRIPRTISLAPVTERGIGAEVARTAEPTVGRVLDVLPAGAGDAGPPWVVLSHPGSAPHVTAIRIGTAAAPIELARCPGRYIDGQVIASAWRTGATRPEGAVVWQGSTHEPPRRPRGGLDVGGEIPAPRTRDRWLWLAVGPRGRRIERLPRVVTHEMLVEERAALALGPAGEVVLARSPYRAQRTTTDVIRFDARARERGRSRDVDRDRNLGVGSIAVDAAGTAWLAGLSSGLEGGPSGTGRSPRIALVTVAPGRGGAVVARRPDVEGRAHGGHTELLECGGTMWVIASVFDETGERWIAFRADRPETTVALTQRPAEGRGRGVFPLLRTIETGCDGDRAVALLISERPRPARDRDPWPPAHVAFVSWDARTGT